MKKCKEDDNQTSRIEEKARAPAEEDEFQASSKRTTSRVRLCRAPAQKSLRFRKWGFHEFS